MEIRGLIKGLPKNIPDWEELLPVCLLTESTEIPIVPTIDVSKISPGFMIQMDFALFNVESIRGFTSTLHIYVLVLHNPLDLHLEENVYLLTP